MEDYEELREPVKMYDQVTYSGEDSPTTSNEEGEEITLRVSPSPDVDRVVVDTNTHANLSPLTGSKVSFIDFYRDARTFLEKANSTKFIIVSFILLSSPLLLYMDLLSETVYREIIIIISLTYLGVDVYERKSLVKTKDKGLL